MMEVNRRNFFRALGITGAGMMLGSNAKAAPRSGNSKEFCAILYDSTRCQYCRGCEYDCAEANNLPEPIPTKQIKGLRKPDEKSRTVVNMHHTSKGDVPAKIQCMHCNDPACGAACLTEAMHKTEEGPVIWRGEKCMGCRYCMVSCPFDMPKFEYHSANPKIEKCTMCFDTRVQKGELPACVENCPAEALVFGTRRELLQEARKRIVENPEKYYDHIYGEHEAGGTGWLYLSPVPFEELGFNTAVQQSSVPALTKGFLYSVPSVFVLAPALLLGIQQSTRTNYQNNEDDEQL